MSERARISLILGVTLLISSSAAADDARLFRTVPTDTPKLGVLRASNSTFYSAVKVNTVLINNYAVEQTKVLTSVTDFELGLPLGLALTGTIPYYADMFSQQGKRGYKAGAGDIAAGIRMSLGGKGTAEDRFGIGLRFLIPEKLGFDGEPLGFRTFSTGQYGVSVEIGQMRRIGFADWRFSGALVRFPGAPSPGAVSSREILYDTGFGYRGIGAADSTGFAKTVFLDQIQFVGGVEIPIHRGIAGLAEMHAAIFTESPKRDAVLRLTPGLRFGSAEGINAAVGVDIRLRGEVPDNSVVFRVSVPSLSPKDIGQGLGIGRRIPAERQIRSRNALVAVPAFSGTGGAPIDDRDLRNAFQTALGAMEIFNVIPSSAVDRALRQESLVPLHDSPEELGVRLGAQYLIRAEILSYRSVRSASFSIPFVFRLPTTNLTLSARGSVTDLASGKVYDIGVISATVAKGRGFLLFPAGASSDISSLSEPETRMLQRDLAESWVNSFTARVRERMEIFDWKPKRAEGTGRERAGG